MENSKTIVCPNCGAVSSNLDNCEYCGSILVKIASVLMPSSEDIMSEMKNLGFGKSAYVSPKILGKLEECISLSARLNVNTFIGLYIKYDKQHYRMEFRHTPSSSSVLELCFDMNNGNNNQKFIAFENSKISKMFELHQNGRRMYGSVALDNDTRTIAQFIQFLLNDIYSLTDAELTIGPVSTHINHYKYTFGDENKRPVEFVYDKDFKERKYYDDYIENITMKNSSWHLYLQEYSKGLYDKALYDIVFADPILRCKVDESYEDEVDTDTQLALDEDGKVIWGLEESKQKYIAACKGICSRYYYCKNIFLKEVGGSRIFGIISKDYDPQVYGPIEDYIKKEEDKIRQEAASDVEEIINEMQRRHVVARVGTSKSGCLPVLIPIVIIMGILGYVIF